MIIQRSWVFPRCKLGKRLGQKLLLFDRQIDPEVDWANGDYELRDFYKKMFEIRSNCNVLKYCSVSNAWKSGGNIYAYMREYEGRKYCSDELLGWRSNVYLNLSFLSFAR